MGGKAERALRSVQPVGMCLRCSLADELSRNEGGSQCGRAQELKTGNECRTAGGLTDSLNAILDRQYRGPWRTCSVAHPCYG